MCTRTEKWKTHLLLRKISHGKLKVASLLEVKWRDIWFPDIAGEKNDAFLEEI